MLEFLEFGIGAMKEPQILGEERKRALATLTKSLGLDIQDVSLINRAFIHTSYANEMHLAEHLNNERLEFLGDAVLGFLVSEYLYKHSKTLREGDLSKMKARVVCQKVLARRATEIGLGNYLLLGRGEELSGGRYRDSILADCLEALVGAVLLECGMDVVREFLHANLSQEMERVRRGKGHVTDHKSILQEAVQKELNLLPKYRVVRTVGPDHDPTFEVTVSTRDVVLGMGQGKSKKDAEQLAAQNALENIPAAFNEIRGNMNMEKPTEGSNQCGK